MEVISGPEPAARLATRTRPTDAAMSNPRETFARVVVGSNAWRAVAVMAPRGSVTSSAQSPNDTVLARPIAEAYRYPDRHPFDAVHDVLPSVLRPDSY